MRRKLWTAAAAAGIFVGAVGLGGVSTQALAAVVPGLGESAAVQPQAAPGTGPGTTCPFLGSDGAPDLDTMRKHMDAVHGEGAFEQMQSWMGGAGMHPGFGPHGVR